MKKLEMEYGAFTYTIIFYLMLCIRFGKDYYITFKLTLHLAGRLFWIFERHGGVLRTRQKNCYKSCLLHPNHLKLGTTYLWTSPKTLPVVTWSKWWRQHSFWRLNHSTTNFLSYFQIFPLPKQYSQGKTVLLSSIQQQHLLGCFWPFSYFYAIN